MSRPKISLENHEAVYDWYSQRQPNPRVARFAHYVLGMVLYPDTTFELGAEEGISRHFGNDGLVLLIANHRSTLDPLVLAALVQQNPALHPLIGNVVIPAKSEVQAKLPYRVLRRPLFDNFVLVPAFRSKDLKNSKLPMAEAEALQKDAAKGLTGALAGFGNKGNSIAYFPHGERVKPKSDDPIRAGIGYLAMGLEDRARFAMLPIGIYGSKATPNLYVGNLLSIPDTRDKVVAKAAWAVRYYEHRAAEQMAA